MNIILHQTGPKQLPEIYQKCSNTWNCSNITKKFYNDKDLDILIKEKCPENYPFYSKLRKIEKIDFARYVMMYYYGGIYADMDTILKDKKYFSKLFLKKDKIVLGIEYNKLRYHTAQSILISTSKKKKIWLDLIEYIKKIYDVNNYITYNTGPDMFTSFVKRYRNKYNIEFQSDLLPYIVKHVKTGSWRLPSYKLLNKNCLLCHNTPYTCFCYSHKWYEEEKIFYYNWKLYIIIISFLTLNMLFFI